MESYYIYKDKYYDVKNILDQLIYDTHKCYDIHKKYNIYNNNHDNNYNNYNNCNNEDRIYEINKSIFLVEGSRKVLRNILSNYKNNHNLYIHLYSIYRLTSPYIQEYITYSPDLDDNVVYIYDKAEDDPEIDNDEYDFLFSIKNTKFDDYFNNISINSNNMIFSTLANQNIEVGGTYNINGVQLRVVSIIS